MNKKEFKRKNWIVNTLASAAIYILIIFAMSGGLINRATNGILMTVCINIILAVSLNLTTGYLGQLALGHAGFMALGAYASAIFSKSVAIENDLVKFLVALLLGGLFAAVFGFLIGMPALRLKGDYLAIITLGFGEIIRVVIEALGITGGAQGLRSIPKVATLPVSFIVMVLTIAVLYTLINSRHGRAIIAIREDEIAAESMGINITYYKTLAFTVAAFFAGVAGAMYAHYIGILGASNFDFNRSIEIVVTVVLGGLGSFTGSIVAAIALTLLPFMLRAFSEYRMLIYSIALIVVMIFKPSGLFGQYEFSLTRLINKIMGKSDKNILKKEAGSNE